MNVSSLTSVGMNNRDSLQPISLQPLATALSNGNLTSAKVAFNNIIGKIPPRGPQPPVTLDNKKATNIDWKPLAISIYAGNLPGAQTAFNQISNSMQNDSHLVTQTNQPISGSGGSSTNNNDSLHVSLPSNSNDSLQVPLSTNSNDSKQVPIGPTGIPISAGSSIDSSLDFTI